MAPALSAFMAVKDEKEMVDWASMEFCYSPIIQSWSTTTGYDLRLTVESSLDTIAHKGVFLIACIIVDPLKEQEAIYNLLLSMLREMLREIKDGISACEVYQQAWDIVKKEKPELEKNFVKNDGFGTGMEFHDSAYLLSSKNSKHLKTYMVLNLSLGFSNWLDDNGKKYALHIVDTIHVGADRSTLLTEGAKSTKDTHFFQNPKNEIEVEEDKPSKPSKKVPVKPLVNISPIKNKTVGGKISIDHKAQTIVLPVHGFTVPFHINTSKNVSKNDEGDYTYLCINFQTPGQLAGKKDDTPFEDPNSTFIHSVTYQSSDGHRFDTITISKQITDLKKEVNKHEQQKKEMADIIEQDVLLETKGRHAHKLPEVFIHLTLDGKWLPGEVEIHQNSLHYQSPMGSQKIGMMSHFLLDIPCDKELMVIVHIHLRAPIMIGKKKAHDIQFFHEASDIQFDETCNRKENTDMAMRMK
ncbi:FACT complex subunit-domain-containing protein [Suillus spraguei]|nr:FACT complex subunit-domain-containing protein [Suillus spraguei]